MNPRIRVLLLSLSGIGVALFLTGFQIADYPFRKSQFGVAEGTRKVYKTETEKQIKVHMEKMSKEIGVKCTFCHNVKDYTSEEKPMKDFVRHKMQMVEWLNAKYRPKTAAWEYSCYTCHRGQVKPVPSSASLVPGGRVPAQGK
jgi:hypothetical protein